MDFCEILRKNLNDSSLFSLYFSDSTGSTNEDAKLLAKNGAKEKTAVISLSQTKGKGRLKRSFFSPFGGLYLSVILRPFLSISDTVLLTALAAVAAARVIEKFFLKKAGIKWVNDIFIDNKKVCGILCEGAINSSENALDYAVLGVGFNLSGNKNLLPEDIKNTADFLSEKPLSIEQKAKFCAAFLNEFFSLYQTLPQKNFLEEYRKYLLFKGETVSFYFKGEKIFGELLDIDDNAALIVKLLSGEKLKLGSGEISIRPII